MSGNCCLYADHSVVKDALVVSAMCLILNPPEATLLSI